MTPVFRTVRDARWNRVEAFVDSAIERNGGPFRSWAPFWGWPVLGLTAIRRSL